MTNTTEGRVSRAQSQEQGPPSARAEFFDVNSLFFTTSVSVRKGRGQHAVIKLRMMVMMMMMTNGPIRVKQANQSSAVIGQYV